MKKFLSKSFSIYSSLVLVFVLNACTNYLDPEPVYEAYELPEDSTVITRKVLIVSIDGLVGNELKKEVPPTIAEMLEHSKYSFESIADENTSDPASWATMMTGVGHHKHGIQSTSYLPAPDPSDPHHAGDYYPSIFYRVAEHDPRMVTTAITQTPGLANVLLLDASQSLIAANDEQVKTDAVRQLTQGNPDLLLVQFKSVLDAGTQSSFSFDSPEYKTAVQEIDGYLGELKAAMEARPTFDREEWLFVVTSNHGGVDNTYGGDSYQERNTFTMYHHAAFVGQELKADIFVSPRFFGYDVNNSDTENAMRGRNVSVPAEEINYNIANTGELTVEAKVKINRNADGNYSYSWPPFLSKVAARTGNTAGWSLFRSGNNVSFFVADGNAKIEITGGPVGVDEVWTHITGTFAVIDGIPTAKFYVNGLPVASGELETLNVGAIASSSPLTFGFQQEVFSSAYIDFYMADVHIWNAALTDEEVLANAERIGVSEDHPRLENLVGYWPLDDGDETFRNQVDGMPDIPVWGKASYNVFGNNLPYVDPEKAILFKSQDIMPHVLYWLHINVLDSWAIDGQNFLKNFELEFLN